LVALDEIVHSQAVQSHPLSSWKSSKRRRHHLCGPHSGLHWKILTGQRRQHSLSASHRNACFNRREGWPLAFMRRLLALDILQRAAPLLPTRTIISFSIYDYSIQKLNTCLLRFSGTTPRLRTLVSYVALLSLAAFLSAIPLDERTCPSPQSFMDKLHSFLIRSFVLPSFQQS
jgi:hypothetical protein